MLPAVQGLFTLVRALTRGSDVTEISTSPWMVRVHGLSSMMALAGVPDFRGDLAEATVKWTQIENTLTPLVGELAESGVRVVLLKGVSYAKTLYDRPAARRMSDIDLLVHADDVALADRVLRRAGFSISTAAPMHHASTWVRGDIVIDLHRSIIAPGRSRIDLAGVWSRTTPSWLAGASTLEASDALVFHLVHLARNRFRAPLVNVVDASRLMERVPDGDVGPALRRANEWGLGPMTRLALRFCRSIIDDVPGRPAGWLGPTREEIAQLDEVSLVRRAAFDALTAGSVRQLAARAVGYGVDRLYMRLRVP